MVSRGQATDPELVHFVRQFSVFSNQFLVAALLRVINAPTLQQARSAKEILMNELGVIYRRTGGDAGTARAIDDDSKEREGDPELVSTEGTVDGGIFRFKAAHFEWLLAVGEALGLGFHNLGKRKQGQPYTLKFCDELIRLFGSEDDRLAEGASFAVENWAAAGFWQELEDGLLHIKATRIPNLKVAFFTWHNRVEAQHAGHMMEELEEVFFSPKFDQARFFQERTKCSTPSPSSGTASKTRPAARRRQLRRRRAWNGDTKDAWHSSALTTCGCSWAMRASPHIFIGTRSASK